MYSYSWRCNCFDHGGPTHSAWAERIVEGNEPDQQARRWMRVTYRHDGIRDALWTALRRIPDVQATLEPRVTTPRGPGDQWRIKVHKDGTTWLGNMGVVCPGTRRLRVHHHHRVDDANLIAS